MDLPGSGDWRSSLEVEAEGEVDEEGLVWAEEVLRWGEEALWWGEVVV